MKILITSALPYANGALHFGHIAGAYLPADCYARFSRSIGCDVLYICGSDEHGLAVTLSAQMEGRSVKDHVDYFHEVIKDFFKKLNISFDHYSRTSWEGHVETTQQYFKDLLKNGFIEEKITNHLYSEKDKVFLADRYVVGICPKCGYDMARGDECTKCGANYEATDLKNPRSKLTNESLILKPTKHWFLRFDLLKDDLRKWIDKKRWKYNVTCFAKNLIDDLKPRAISRDSNWGVKLPCEGSDGKVLYVWFDAPIGYISATKEWAIKRGNEDEWKNYWLDPDTKLVQFIGKDNIPFHAVFFPAMTIGQDIGYKTVDELPANEFFYLEGKQFSKSDGWYIDLDDCFSKFSSDQIRYAIASNAPETRDSEFSWKDFQIRCNKELLGKYGNFAYRVITFANNHLEGIIPNKKEDDLKDVDKLFLKEVKEITEEIYTAYSNFHLRKATRLIMKLSQNGNAYFDYKEPWKYSKDKSLSSSMENTIYCSLLSLKKLALISYPIIPDTGQKLWQSLGFKTSISKVNWHESLEFGFYDDQKLMTAERLFLKIEDSVIDYEIKSLIDRMNELEKKGKKI